MIYLIVLLATWLLLIGLFGSTQSPVAGFLLLAGLILYGFGLFLISNLLKKKCEIRRMIYQLKLV